MGERPVTFTKDGIIAYPTADSVEGGSIRIPQTSTSLGAGFGEPITPDDLVFAVTREPIAGFLIYGIANDVVEKWFKVNDVQTEGADPQLDSAVQRVLRKLQFKRVLQQLVEWERLFGKALLVASFSDVQEQTQLMDKRRRGAEPIQLAVYPKTQYDVATRDEDLSSPRYGQPLIYRVNTQTGQNMLIHWTRCFEAQTRTNAQSILTLIWDDLTCGRNIRWGVSQWIFRTGGGFPVIKFPKEVDGVPTTKAKLQEWANAQEWSDISHRTYICLINELMDFKFEGAQGVALNPEPFFDTNTKQFAKATGIPKCILEGAEAGGLTGSKENDQQQYYKKISGIQVSFEDATRWVIDACLDAGLVKNVRTFVDQKWQSAGSVLKRMLRKVIVQDQGNVAENLEYLIEWNSAFELNVLDEARTAVLVEQANQTRLQYQTIDEVRALNTLKPLPNGEGAKLKMQGQQQLGQQQFQIDQVAGEEKPQTQGNVSFTACLKDYATRVMKGELTRDKAFQEGAVIIDNYNRFEEQQAKIWVRNRTGTEGEITLSPEMMGELEDQKKRFLRDYSRILADAEKLAKKRAG